MPLITWDDTYRVYIAELDQQHKKLINMINDMHAAMLQGTARESIGKIITDLLEYAKKHFASEEKILDAHGFPEAAAHKEKHAEFLVQVTEFKEKIETRQFSLSISVMQYLNNWVKNHIKGTDQKYVPFLTGKGVK